MQTPARAWSILMVLFTLPAMAPLYGQTATQSRAQGESDVTAEESTSESRQPQQISTDKAAEFVNRLVTVEYRVNSSRMLAAKKICFLNSQKNYRDEKNFTLVIRGKELLDKFAEAGIEDPASHYYQKTIRVTGTVELHSEKPQIVVAKVKQIETVKQDDDEKDTETVSAVEESR